MATGTINTPSIIFVDVSATNISVSSNGSATASFTKPSKDGYTNLGIVDIWVNGDGTTGATNYGYVIPTNRWSNAGCTLRNFTSGAAKCTAWARYLLVKL